VPDEPAKRRKRKPLRPRSERYAHLPIKETIEIIPDEVLAAPDDYELIDSVEETFEIDFNQIEFYRRAIRRLKFRRKAAKGSEAPVVAPAPVRLSGGIASAHLIALILIAKYWDHLPLHRQVGQYKRYGCELSLDSMVRWVAKAGEWLDRIHQRMRWELLQGNYIQVDETCFHSFSAYMCVKERVTVTRRSFTATPLTKRSMLLGGSSSIPKVALHNRNLNRNGRSSDHLSSTPTLKKTP
jgi:transposase